LAEDLRIITNNRMMTTKFIIFVTFYCKFNANRISLDC
jgi:hypothetical protein